MASNDVAALSWLSQQFPDSYGTDVAAIASASPTFVKEISSTLQMTNDHNWNIVFGDGGSSNQARERTTLPSSLAGNAAGIVGVLSHEFVHADYNGPIAEDATTWSEYEHRQEIEEGAATVGNIQVDNEIYQNTNGGINIGIGASMPGDAQQFLSRYNQYGNTDAAYQAIGNLYPTQTHQDTNQPTGVITYEADWLNRWNLLHGR